MEVNRDDIIRIHDKLDRLEERIHGMEKSTAVLAESVRLSYDGCTSRISGVENRQGLISDDVQFLKDFRRDIRTFFVAICFIASGLATALTLTGQYLWNRISG
jgi:hypothetical protein